MSADNRRVCPRCKQAAEAKQLKLHEAASKAYGKVSREKYAEMVREASKPPNLSDTLREDYELGTSETGQFYVIYGCSCQQCTFGFSFKHEEQVDLAKKGSDE